MAYGKYRNGITSLGRQAANWLQDDRLTWASRRRGAVLTRKSGEFTNIYQTAENKTDGFYAVGALAGAGTHVLAASSYYSDFADRGLVPAGGFTLSELGFYGRGYGSVVKAGTGSFFVDFDGDNAFVTPNTLAITRDGRTLNDVYVFNMAIPSLEASFTQFSILPGGYYLVGDTPTFFTGMFFTGLDGSGQYLQAFIYDNGTSRTLGATEYLVNQVGWFADRCVLAPGVLLKMDRYLRPSHSVTIVDIAACPGLRFNYSTDGGQNWSTVSSAALFDPELATITGLAPVFAQYELFNEAINNTRLRTAPLSRSVSVAVAHVPYIVDVAGTPTVKVRVKLGLVSTASGCALSATTTLFDGLPAAANRFMSRDPLAIPGGVLVFTRPDAGGSEWNAPARIMFTDDGTTLVERALMPLPEYKTGIVTGADKLTLICPMYDGAYTLYRSKDWGVQWTASALITENGVGPSTGALVMDNFSAITELRKDNLHAPAAPATPWQYDCRVAEP